MDVKPFRINISDSELDVLSRKLALARLPINLSHEYWAESNGVTLDFLSSTLDFWRKGYYNWRDEEAKLNELPQFICPVDVEGFGTLDIRFVHSRASAVTAQPLLFVHGWPGSFAEVRKILPLLNHAGFDVVAPSLPGYGFSSDPGQSGFKTRAGCRGDAQIDAETWVREITMPKPDFPTEPVYTEFEKRSIRQQEHFINEEFVYYSIQSSKPRTLGFAMHDSPVGMLAWMVDKLYTWSDHYPCAKTEMIAWTLLHYFPGPTTGFRIYREHGSQKLDDIPYERTSTGVSAFAGEMEMVPRSWAEGTANITFWREHESGGHFAAYEKSDELARDLIDFFQVGRQE